MDTDITEICKITELSSAVFPIFTENWPWKTEDEFSYFFYFILLKMSKEKRKKRPNTSSFKASLGIAWLPWSIERFISVVDVEKRLSWQLFLGVLVSFWRRKPIVTSEVSSKEKRELKLQKQCKPCDDFWVCGHVPWQFHCSRLLHMVPGQRKRWLIFFKNSKWVDDSPPPPLLNTVSLKRNIGNCWRSLKRRNTLPFSYTKL